jgi:hypothetical protein
MPWSTWNGAGVRCQRRRWRGPGHQYDGDQVARPAPSQGPRTVTEKLNRSVLGSTTVFRGFLSGVTDLPDSRFLIGWTGTEAVRRHQPGLDPATTLSPTRAIVSIRRCNWQGSSIVILAGANR